MASPDLAFGDRVHAGRPHVAHTGPDPGSVQGSCLVAGCGRGPVPRWSYRRGGRPGWFQSPRPRSQSRVQSDLSGCRRVLSSGGCHRAARPQRPDDLGGRSGSWLSSLLFQRARYDGQVLLAEPLINGLLPFVSQAGENGEPVVTGRLQREVHVLECERERELGRELADGDPLQLGCLPAGHERAAAKRVHQRLSLKTQPASKSHGRGDRFRRERQPGVVHQLQHASRPRPRRPRTCAGPARRTAESHANAPRQVPTRRSSAGHVLPDPCFPTPARPGASRPDAQHRPWPRRARSPPRRWCSSGPRSRPEPEQQASPGPGRPT